MNGQPSSAALATEVWRQMSELVLDQDRRRQVSEALGLSFIRIKVLRRVARTPMTLRELAGKLVIDPPYATVVVHDLAERGLVQRVPHPTDRLAKLVTVTPAGRQVAALCWRRSPSLEILLITSLKTRRWILPKGWPVDGMTPAQSAAREALEETGLLGPVSPLPVGDYHYLKAKKDGSGLPVRVQVFALEAAGQAQNYAEKGLRRLLWLAPDLAAQKVAETGLARLIRAFAKARAAA